MMWGGRQILPFRVIQLTLNPRFLREEASHDVASSMWQALCNGGMMMPMMMPMPFMGRGGRGRGGRGTAAHILRATPSTRILNPHVSS